MRIFSRGFFALMLFCASLLSACASTQISTQQTAAQPEAFLSLVEKDQAPLPKVTQILVKKEDRKLFLLHGNQILRSYDVDLGFSPEGHKQRQGDGRTPEGLYFIDRKNAQSIFHKSIGISYPNAQDRARAARAGVSPGGDIFIHGESRWAANSGTDWTRGCIALPDRKMDEIFASVSVGTPIMITK